MSGGYCRRANKKGAILLGLDFWRLGTLSASKSRVMFCRRSTSSLVRRLIGSSLITLNLLFCSSPTVSSLANVSLSTWMFFYVRGTLPFKYTHLPLMAGFIREQSIPVNSLLRKSSRLEWTGSTAVSSGENWESRWVSLINLKPR